MVRRVSCPVLVGRDAELAQLRAVLERAASGQPATTLVPALLLGPVAAHPRRARLTRHHPLQDGSGDPRQLV